MKVTYNWLKDFVEIKISPEAFADKLTMAGLEVTSLEKRNGDFVFEIEVTSNRPDCLSILGIAREVAAITDKKLNVKSLMFNAKNIKHHISDIKQLSIKIEDKNDCPLYTAKIIKDVKVGSSPEWLKKRLVLVGCRSVNNVVDITNYVLFEQGQPLHAFDLDRLSGDTIVVRRAKNNEKVTTIDAEEKLLSEDILVIADGKRTVAVAGVMGGKDTQVTASTKNILLEAAVFNPILVRRARQRLGIQSESSYRFERGVDLERLIPASWQAAKLIQEICLGECVLAKYSGLAKTKEKKIVLDLLNVNKILGEKLTSSKIKNILNRLEFRVEPQTKNKLGILTPSHRQDVNLEIDLIEEISRIYGYENIPKTLPKVSPQKIGSVTRGLVSLVKNILIGLGLNEVITYSLIDKEVLKISAIDQASSAIEILNPLTREQQFLRPTIIPSLLKCVASNLNQKQGYVNVFEIAKVFSQAKARPHEELILGIALSGAKSLLLQQGLIKEEASLLHLKGILETLFKRLGIKDYDFNNQDNSCAITICVHKEKAGVMAKLSESILENFGIKNKDVFVLELYLDRIFSYADLQRKFAPLPIYPCISRDISFLLKENIRADDIVRAVRTKGAPLLEEAKIADYYKGKQIPAGFKGLTISCIYRSNERTLTETEINPVHSLICNLLTDKFSAKIRA